MAHWRHSSLPYASPLSIKSQLAPTNPSPYDIFVCRYYKWTKIAIKLELVRFVRNSACVAYQKGLEILILTNRLERRCLANFVDFSEKF